MHEVFAISRLQAKINCSFYNCVCTRTFCSFADETQECNAISTRAK